MLPVSRSKDKSFLNKKESKNDILKPDLGKDEEEVNYEFLTDADIQSAHENYKLAIAARDLEIQQLVHRNNFFMVFQGVLFAGLLQAAGNGKIIPIVSFMVCFAGFAISAFQVGMAAGAKFWQERWEDAVEKAERLLVNVADKKPSRTLVIEAFSAGDTYVQSVVNRRTEGKLIGFLVRSRYSVSRIPIYAACLLCAVWLILLLAQIDLCLTNRNFIAGF